MTISYSLSELSSKDWKPHDYQKKAIKFLLEHAAAGLFLDPGLGKTSIVLGAVKILKSQKLLFKTLVIAPLRVCYGVWPAEAQKWNDFHDLKMVVLHGKDKELALKQEADIYVINPEGLDWLLSNNRLKSLKIDTLVIDESSKFKHTQTKRFKQLKPLLGKFARRWILTGTPAPNGLMDLFGQIYILDLGRAFTPYITKFRLEFFDSVGFGGYTYIPKKGSEERIHELIRPLTLRLEAADYLELPELINNYIYVELPPPVRKIYDQMQEIFMAGVGEDKLLVASTAAVAGMKCRQIANGGVFLGLDYTPAVASDQWQQLHMEKNNALGDLMEELGGQQLLIVYEFQHDLERIRQLFKGRTDVAFAADYSAKKFTEIEQAWNKRELTYLVVQPQSVGHGLNLQYSFAQHICFYSQIWDLEVYEQVIQRILRQGNEAPHVTVHHIVARKTTDEAVVRGLHMKAGVQNRLLLALKDYASEVLG